MWAEWYGRQQGGPTAKVGRPRWLAEREGRPRGVPTAKGEVEGRGEREAACHMVI